MTPNLHVWLIPVLPLIGAAVNGLLGRRFTRQIVSAVALTFCGAAFLWALWVATQFPSLISGPYQETLAPWIRAGDFRADFAFYLDQLSVVMMLVVTGVGFLIHIYSVGYMREEGGLYRFFSYLNLFMFFMLTLVLASNYLLMFIGWEGVGLASYLLIGFWFTKDSAAAAGKKAFIVNRIGDFGFLIALFLLIKHFGSLNFDHVFSSIMRLGPETQGAGLLTSIALLLMVGACGKSAQTPLYVWLPDAMEGPTPVSALIHAATMVTAGVYMIARSHLIFERAPTALTVVAIIGTLTAFFAATIGIAQTDIKRVLAYSTVSQLGYMFMACGVGAFSAGIFHLMTHAFFKGLLFLAAGSVIHAVGGEQDMRQMGGLKSYIPWTFLTMGIATLAIAGIPPLAGFFSKDEILWQAWRANPVLWVIGFATALMTAFYMFRLIFLTFHGQPRMSHEVEHHVHESPKSMTGPLVVLAFFSVTAGWIGISPSLGGSNHIEKFLEPVFARGEGVAVADPAPPAGEEHRSTEWGFMLLSVAAAVVGAGLASRYYRHAGKDYQEPIAAAAPPVYNALFNKYYVDEGYDYLFTGRRKLGDVRLGAMGLGEASSWVDANVVDGAVNGAGWITRVTASLSKWWDTWIIDGIGVNGPAYLARALSYPARVLEWGLVQWYALVMVIGLVYFVCLELGYSRDFWFGLAGLLVLTLVYLFARYLRQRFAT